MKEYEYYSGRYPGGRHPKLFLYRDVDGCIERFQGESVSGMCQIATAAFEKCGQWSNTRYTLLLAPGVRPLYFLAGLHTEWGEKLKTWVDVAASLAIPLASAKKIVREIYPRTAQRLDDTEAFLDEHEDRETEVIVVTVIVGRPRTRETAEATHPEAGTIVIAPSRSQHGALDWYAPTVVSPPEAKIATVRHSPGHRGGHFEVEVLVPVRHEFAD